MTTPTWAILIPTIGQRAPLFRRLLDVLLPQLGPDVEVIGWFNEGAPTLGEIRDGLLAEAHRAGAEYVSFIDDDDLVPDYYVADVRAALATRPDHIGFRMHYHSEATVSDAYEVVEHSIRWGRWGRSADGLLYRDINHIDPIRTDIALRGQFAAARAGRAEDRAWVKQVRPFVATEVFVERILYHYLWSHELTAWQRPDLVERGHQRPAVDHPHFRWHPDSL